MKVVVTHDQPGAPNGVMFRVTSEKADLDKVAGVIDMGNVDAMIQLTEALLEVFKEIKKVEK